MAQTVCTCGIDGVNKAHKAISFGGVIIFPTDTVYGIACSPYEKNAIRRVYKIKGRSATKHLPVLADSYKDLENFCKFDSRHKKMAEKFWPGPITMVVKLLDKDIAKAMDLVDTIAVRVPSGECARSVLAACGPLACTSANISGSPSAINYEQCSNLDADVGLDGGTVKGGIESTIIDVARDKLHILRKGPVLEKEVYSTWED
ncbi:MAG: Sua5/YciO/YrdC/YwlC family protein [Cenarchaeum symbiont of Oopsacas minuta]|nr:Sua5/YciO/YrdC/YwlC family protein [Cenarchaeum symbiont of Oopsacas minuta]